MGIYKRGDGWEVAVPTGERYKNGRPKYRRELLPTKEEARNREREILNTLANQVTSIYKYSCRTVKINELDIDVLREYKFKQHGKQNDFVCLDTFQRPIGKDSIGPNFRDQAKRKGYDICFHSLRHSHATILILIYKVPIKTVSRRLGHSDISVTLSIYAQFIQEQDELCSQAMETAFRTLPETHKKLEDTHKIHTNTHKIHTKTLAI